MGGTYCCVPGCFNNTAKSVGVSFQKFPDDKNLRRKWLQAINRQGDKGKFSVFDPKSHSRVCGRHFKGGKKGYLDRVPSIFPLKSVENNCVRRAIKIRDFNQNLSDNQESDRPTETIVEPNMTTEMLEVILCYKGTQTDEIELDTQHRDIQVDHEHKLTELREQLQSCNHKLCDAQEQLQKAHLSANAQRDVLNKQLLV